MDYLKKIRVGSLITWKTNDFIKDYLFNTGIIVLKTEGYFKVYWYNRKINKSYFLQHSYGAIYNIIVLSY